MEWATAQSSSGSSVRPASRMEAIPVFAQTAARSCTMPHTQSLGQSVAGLLSAALASGGPIVCKQLA